MVESMGIKEIRKKNLRVVFLPGLRKLVKKSPHGIIRATRSFLSKRLTAFCQHKVKPNPLKNLHILSIWVVSPIWVLQRSSAPLRFLSCISRF